MIGAIAGGVLADWNVHGALAAVAGCYALAAWANLLIPKLARAHTLPSYSISAVFRDFVGAVRRLIKVPDARFSIIGTSLFRGTGSTMRFLLIAWVPVALGITNNRMPAYLNAMVAVGIVLGAGLAVCLLSATRNSASAFVLLTIVGAGGGFFVVPLNALLQEKGRQSVGAGHAIAIQNLAENSAMLLMIGAYTAIMWAGSSVTVVAASFGALLSLTIAALWWFRVRAQRRRLLNSIAARG